MWSKQQLWRFLMLTAGIFLLAWTAVFSIEIGWSVALVTIPLIAFVFFVNRMFVKTLKISKDQAEQTRRHVEELSHYIAEQEQAAKIIQKSEEKFRNAFDFASIGMALISAQGQILKVNRAFCDTAGYSDMDLLELNFRQMIYGEDLHLFNITLAKLVSGNEEAVPDRNAHPQ